VAIVQFATFGIVLQSMFTKGKADVRFRGLKLIFVVQELQKPGTYSVQWCRYKVRLGGPMRDVILHFMGKLRAARAGDVP
jgi:hypothetical protein